MDTVLAVDFGSTFTKGILFDRSGEEVISVAQTPSTVTTDVTVGLQRVIAMLGAAAGMSLDRVPAYACSSAAGGLRVAVVGLVPVLSLEAAQRAALGAGAKVVGAYGYKLMRRNVAELEQSRPDIVLLCGGTDGGDENNILYNAKVLGDSALDAPFIVAGNEIVQDECLATLGNAGKLAFSAANLLPEVGRIDVEDVHRIIRELFITRITQAKGIDRVREYLNLESDIVPTPSAVLAAARLLADGTALTKGFGDIVLVDVGGATTDVYSVASGAPTRPGVITRGLPELRLKRTVEGDLGMRINAPTIVERCGTSRVLMLAKQLDSGDLLRENDVSAYAAQVALDTGHVPVNCAQRALDLALGRSAVGLAVHRHVGALREVYTPSGTVLVQEGKDLGNVAALVGVGGVLAHGGEGAEFILEGALNDPCDPFTLLPRSPSLYLDHSYVLYGIGLISEFAPDAALTMARRSLSALER